MPQGQFNGGYQGGPHYPPPGGPGFPGGPPAPPKRNTGLIVTLAVLGVAVAVGAVMTILSITDTTPLTPIPTMSTGPSTDPSVQATTTPPPVSAAEIDKAKAHAERFLAAVNAKDEATATSLTCKKERPGPAYTGAVDRLPAGLLPEPRTVESDRVVLDVKISHGGPLPMELYLEGGKWCVFT